MLSAAKLGALRPPQGKPFAAQGKRELELNMKKTMLVESAAMIFSSNSGRTPCQEETSHVPQHIDLADPQSSRRLR
jgi:hypothetical protein